MYYHMIIFFNAIRWIEAGIWRTATVASYRSDKGTCLKGPKRLLPWRFDMKFDFILDVAFCDWSFCVTGQETEPVRPYKLT